MMDELFKQKTGLTSANNTNIMSGIELGRAESAKKIKEIEDRNAELVDMLAESRYLPILVDMVAESRYLSSGGAKEG